MKPYYFKVLTVCLVIACSAINTPRFNTIALTDPLMPVVQAEKLFEHCEEADSKKYGWDNCSELKLSTKSWDEWNSAKKIGRTNLNFEVDDNDEQVIQYRMSAPDDNDDGYGLNVDNTYMEISKHPEMTIVYTTRKLSGNLIVSDEEIRNNTDNQDKLVLPSGRYQLSLIGEWNNKIHVLGYVESTSQEGELRCIPEDVTVDSRNVSEGNRVEEEGKNRTFSRMGFKTSSLATSICTVNMRLESSWTNFPWRGQEYELKIWDTVTKQYVVGKKYWHDCLDCGFVDNPVQVTLQTNHEYIAELETRSFGALWVDGFLLINGKLDPEDDYCSSTPFNLGVNDPLHGLSEFPNDNDWAQLVDIDSSKKYVVAFKGSSSDYSRLDFKQSSTDVRSTCNDVVLAALPDVGDGVQRYKIVEHYPRIIYKSHVKGPSGAWYGRPLGTYDLMVVYAEDTVPQVSPELSACSSTTELCQHIFKVQDTGSGLADISRVKGQNVTLSPINISIGAKDDVVIFVNVVDRNQPWSVSLRVTDVAGNTITREFSNAVHLIAPPNEATLTTQTVAQISAYTAYFVWDGYSPRYELHWDTDNAFTDPITVVVGTMEFSSPTLASKLTAGQYFWRVRGMDDYGPATDWSNTNTFTVIANQPATKTWAGTFQVSYMWAAMNGGGEDGSGSPYNSDLPNLQRTYCGKETAPWGIRNLEPGIYEARIITGTQSGYANSACTNSWFAESSTIENFWPWVIQHNPLALKPGTGFNGGSLTAYGNLAGNPNPGWMSMADIWVGQSESDGTRYHIERPPNNPDSPSSSTVFPLMQSETIWFYLNDWIMSDNLGGSTIELSRIGDLPAGVTTTVYNLSPNLNGNDVLLDHFDSLPSEAGSIHGNVVITQGILNLGQAAQLQTGGYVQYAIPGWYTSEITHSGTVELWVRPQAYGELLYLTDRDVKDPTGLNHYMRLELDRATGRLRYAVLTDTVESTFETNATLPLNTWSHIAVTWSGNGTKLYINGRLANDNWADSNFYPLLGAQNYLYLNGWGTGNFAGQIDELHISKVSLGADEFWYHATGVRDKFDLPDGPISQNWFGPEGYGGYTVRSGRVKLLGGGLLYWNNSRQGADQEASIQFVKVITNAYQQSVLLKVQGEPPYWVNGAIAVFYDARNANGPSIRIETRLPPTLDAWEWKRYDNKPLVIHDGDTLRGRVTSTGVVYVYLNDALVLTQPLDEADKTFFNGKGGYIGLEMIDAAGALLDNFGGGTIASAESLSSDAPQSAQREFVIEESETPTVHAYLPLAIK